MKPVSRFLTCAILSTLAVSPAYAGGLDVAGVWLTADKDGQVEIYDCGNATPCGQLIWYDRAKGGGPLDRHNPIAQLRGRPLIGVSIFWGFKRHQGRWTGGNIYNPEDGKTFQSRLRMGPDDKLIVTGCLGPICVTRAWTRVNALSPTRAQSPQQAISRRAS